MTSGSEGCAIAVLAGICMQLIMLFKKVLPTEDGHLSCTTDASTASMDSARRLGMSAFTNCLHGVFALGASILKPISCTARTPVGMCAVRNSPETRNLDAQHQGAI